jgi:Protein of unknown function (DUF3987)
VIPGRLGSPQDLRDVGGVQVLGLDSFDPRTLHERGRVSAVPGGRATRSVGQQSRRIGHRDSTDPAMAGTAALTAVAACVGGRVTVQVRPGWREPLNLFTVTVARAPYPLKVTHMSRRVFYKSDNHNAIALLIINPTILYGAPRAWPIKPKVLITNGESGSINVPP